jgi:AcrR family transcriptional regulator
MKSEVLDLPAKAGRDAKREAILKIAYQAFLADGYAATSMSAIAAKVGGSKATLYNHFTSKEELFIAVIEEKCQDFMHLVFETDFDPENIEVALHGLGRRFLTLLLSEDKIAVYRLITASAAQFPALGRAFYKTSIAKGRERLSRIFAQAIADGKLRPGDTDMMANHFFGLCEGDFHRRRLWNMIDHASEAEIQTYVSQAMRVFFAAYGV